MADSGKAFRQAIDVVGKGYYTGDNKKNIVLYAGLIYIGDGIKEAIAEAAKMWKGKQFQASDIAGDEELEEVSTGMDAGNIVEIPDVVQLGPEGKRFGCEPEVPDVLVTPQELRVAAYSLEQAAELPEGHEAVFCLGVCRFKYIFKKGRKAEDGGDKEEVT